MITKRLYCLKSTIVTILPIIKKWELTNISFQSSFTEVCMSYEHSKGGTEHSGKPEGLGRQQPLVPAENARELFPLHLIPCHPTEPPLTPGGAPPCGSRLRSWVTPLVRVPLLPSAGWGLAQRSISPQLCLHILCCENTPSSSLFFQNEVSQWNNSHFTVHSISNNLLPSLAKSAMMLLAKWITKIDLPFPA